MFFTIKNGNIQKTIYARVLYVIIETVEDWDSWREAQSLTEDISITLETNHSWLNQGHPRFRFGTKNLVQLN